MNKPLLPTLLADPEFGSEKWRRRFLNEHIEAEIRDQQRRRFLGQIFFVVALIGIGAILYWAAAALGLDVRPAPGEIKNGTIVATAALGVAVLAMAVVLWDSRLKLDRSRLDLLRRELERLRLDEKE